MLTDMRRSANQRSPPMGIRTLVLVAWISASCGAHGAGGKCADDSEVECNPKRESVYSQDANARATLRIVHITDVYTLNNFPSLATAIRQLREELQREQPGSRTISVLTGDFLMPYLLSTVDHGKGMMRMLNAAPIDFLSWGNHEHDLAHEHVLEREREYLGTWINSNMQEHESFANSTCQVDSAMIEILSADETNVRRVGLVAVLSNEASLYRPGAFGGATIADPWKTLEQYKTRLEQAGVDVVVPLCHLYEWQDDKTAALFDFPVILSGHDHHAVDRVVNGSRLLKPGQDAIVATVVDLSWPDGQPESSVQVSAGHINVTDWQPDQALAQIAKEAYAALDPLRQTQLAVVPPKYRPLTSRRPRERRVSVATYLCTLLRSGLDALGVGVDIVIIQGGFFKASLDYTSDTHLSLELLHGELMTEQKLLVCLLPGRVLKEAIRDSWARPSPGWMQMDSGVQVEDGNVVTIAGEPVEDDKLYRVCSYKELRRLRDARAIGDYFATHPEHWSTLDTGRTSQEWILEYAATAAWDQLASSETLCEQLLSDLDSNANGAVETNPAMSIKDALHSALDFSVHVAENSFSKRVARVALKRGCKKFL